MNDLLYYLPMANDVCWCLKAVDPKVVPFVERFAAVCGMRETQTDPSDRIFECHVSTFDELNEFRQKHPDLTETGRKHYYRLFFSPSLARSHIFLNMDEYQSEIMQTLAVNTIDVAMQLQMVGGAHCAPCHCALLEINGRGVVIVGPGDSGKTTCATRIPAPHQALADDYALIFAHQHKLLAQAMPTWSNLLNGDSEYRADCSRVTEVKAFFFLRQARKDDIKPINGLAALWQMNTVLQDLLALRTLINTPEKLQKDLRQGIFDLAERFCQRKKTFLLYASLGGQFWKPIENEINNG